MQNEIWGYGVSCENKSGVFYLLYRQCNIIRKCNEMQEETYKNRTRICNNETKTKRVSSNNIIMETD
jgi:hypothetical protein